MFMHTVIGKLDDNEDAGEKVVILFPIIYLKSHKH